MAVIEIPSGAFEKEHRHRFSAQSPSGDHVVASGTMNLGGVVIGTSDEHFEDYEIRAVVGPWWKDVQNVVPLVTASGFNQDDWDEVDEAGWTIRELTWDTVGGNQAPHLDEERIRLKFHLAVKGEGSSVTYVSYYFTARGRELGKEGLNSP